jgi:hypothetical protein
MKNLFTALLAFLIEAFFANDCYCQERTLSPETPSEHASSNKPDFSKYLGNKDSEAMEYFISKHKSGEAFDLTLFKEHDNPLPKEPLLLAITQFYETGEVAFLYRVTQKGTALVWRETYNWSRSLQKRWAMTDKDRQNLIITLSQLPKTNIYPEVGDLAIVSFWSGGTWGTYTTDTKAIKPLLVIIGADWKQDLLNSQ